MNVPIGSFGNMLTLCSSSSGEMVIWRSTLIFTESQSAFLASLSFCWLEHLEVLERRATVYHARGKDKTLRNEFQLPKHQVILLNVLAHLTNSTSCTGSTSAIKTSQVSLDTSSSYAHAQWSMPPYASYYQPSWSPSHIPPSPFTLMVRAGNISVCYGCSYQFDQES